MFSTVASLVFIPLDFLWEYLEFIAFKVLLHFEIYCTIFVIFGILNKLVCNGPIGLVKEEVF